MENFRAVFIIGCIIGFSLIAIGAYAIYLFFAVTPVMTHAEDEFYGNYGIIGIFLIGSGLLFLSQCYPILIPLKKNSQNDGTCPYCGAIIEENAAVCSKCNRPLKKTEETAPQN